MEHKFQGNHLKEYKWLISFLAIVFNAILILLIFAIKSSAVETVIVQPLDLGKQGETYEIKEKDWWELLQEKYKKFAKEGNITERLELIVKKQYEVNTNLPLCKEDSLYEKEIIYTVPEDIVWQGVVLYKKGYKLNILEKMPLNGYIIIANYATKEDKEQLLNLINENKMQLRVFIAKGNIKEFQEDIYKYFPNRYNIITGKMTKLLIDRFDTRCVPTIMYQKDFKLVINEIGVEDGKKN